MPEEPVSDDRNDPADDAIGMRFNSASRILEVKCRPGAFARFLELARREVAPGRPAWEGERVAMMMIVDASYSPEKASAGRGWRDQVALLGCATICLAFLFLGFAGVVQIAAWFRG